MKKHLSTFVLYFFSTVVVASCILSTAHAEQANLYLEPHEGLVEQGWVFDVELYLGNSNSTGVEANIEFDRTRLQVLGAYEEGSDFDNVNTDYNNLNGTISVLAIDGSGSGNQLVTILTFKSTAQGNAAIVFKGNNRIIVGNNNGIANWVDVATKNASFVITPKNSLGGAAANTATPPEDNTPPSQATKDNLPEKSEIKSNEPKPASKNTEDSTLAKNTQKEKRPIINSLLWPTIPIASLAILTIAIFLLYRSNHMSGSLKRLIVSVLEYKPTIPLSKYLTYSGPKLLASGIKHKLLSASNKLKND